MPKCIFCKREMPDKTFCCDETNASIYFYENGSFLLIENESYGICDPEKWKEFENLPDDQIWESSLEDGEVYCPKYKLK